MFLDDSRLKRDVSDWFRFIDVHKGRKVPALVKKCGRENLEYTIPDCVVAYSLINIKYLMNKNLLFWLPFLDDHQ